MSSAALLPRRAPVGTARTAIDMAIHARAIGRLGWTGCMVRQCAFGPLAVKALERIKGPGVEYATAGDLRAMASLLLDGAE